MSFSDGLRRPRRRAATWRTAQPRSVPRGRPGPRRDVRTTSQRSVIHGGPRSRAGRRPPPRPLRFEHHHPLTDQGELPDFAPPEYADMVQQRHRGRDQRPKPQPKHPKARRPARGQRRRQPANPSRGSSPRPHRPGVDSYPSGATLSRPKGARSPALAVARVQQTRHPVHGRPQISPAREPSRS